MAGSPRARRAGEQPPAGYDIDRYPRFAVTVDVVVLTVDDGGLKVLLIRRSADPYAGRWALPGGFKRPDETLDEAAARELREETGIRAGGRLRQFRSYGDPGRDPRANVVTVAYVAAVASVGRLAAGGDARDAALHPVDAVRYRSTELAFDHRHIVLDAVEDLRSRMELSDVALSFVGPEFTLTGLRRVYEAVWDERLDMANFRRSLSGPDPYVEGTGRIAAPGREGGRPPELFRATRAWRDGPPLRRSRRSG